MSDTAEKNWQKRWINVLNKCRRLFGFRKPSLQHVSTYARPFFTFLVVLVILIAFVMISLAPSDHRHYAVRKQQQLVPRQGTPPSNDLFGAPSREPSHQQVRRSDGSSSSSSTSSVVAANSQPYCDAELHTNIPAMVELVHRIFDIPVDESNPAFIREMQRSEINDAAFAKSITQLEQEKHHDWHYMIEGTSRVTVRPYPSLISAGAKGNPFVDLDGGFYCLSVWDDVDSCIVASIPFAVIDSDRRDSEYGVTPVLMDKHGVSLYRDIAEHHPEAPLLSHASIVVHHPRYAPYGGCIPLIMSIPSIMEEFYAGRDFIGRDEDHDAHSFATEMRHVRLGGSTRRNDPSNVDLHFGRGSMWLMTYEAFEFARQSFARRDRKFLGIDKHLSEGVKETVFDRALFEHYAMSQYVILDANRAEDEPLDDGEIDKDNWGSERRRMYAQEEHNPLPTSASKQVVGNRHRQISREEHKRRNEPFLWSAHVPVLDRTIDVTTVPLFTITKVQTLKALKAYFDAERNNNNNNKNSKQGANHTPSFCALRISNAITFTESFTLKRECLLVFDEHAVLKIAKGVTVTIEGERADRPVYFTSQDIVQSWGGIIVEDGGEFATRFAVYTRVGSNNIPRVKGTGTHIKSYTPVFTASPGAATKLIVRETSVVNCEGTVFALGAGSTTQIEDVLVQDVAQGGECVSCKVNILRSHFIDFPYVSPELDNIYVDADNDGFYFRGGQAVVQDTVFVNALDDCIDSASSKGDDEHSTLTLSHVALVNCQHEGVALSGSKGTYRKVTIENSLIRGAQQGVENGHTPTHHMASVTRTVFLQNQVGLRNGDNYPTLDVFGRVKVSDSLFLHNVIPVLDWVQIDHTRKAKRKTFYDSKLYRYETHNPTVKSDTSGMQQLLLSNCVVEQPSHSLPEAPEGHNGRNRSMRANLGSGLMRDVNVSVEGRQDKELPVDVKLQHSSAVKRYSSSDFGKGLFCGLKHFEVEAGQEILHRNNLKK